MNSFRNVATDGWLYETQLKAYITPKISICYQLLIWVTQNAPVEEIMTHTLVDYMHNIKQCYQTQWHYFWDKHKLSKNVQNWYSGACT